MIGPGFVLKLFEKTRLNDRWKQRMEAGLLISPNWIFVGWIDLKKVQRSGIHITQTMFHLIKTLFEVPCLQTTCSFEIWSHRKASLIVHSCDMPEKNKNRKGEVHENLFYIKHLFTHVYAKLPGAASKALSIRECVIFFSCAFCLTSQY